MTSENTNLLTNDLFFNEQDDDFLRSLESIIEVQKEDFDWFNNLHLNYTPVANAVTDEAAQVEATTAETKISTDDTLTVINLPRQDPLLIETSTSTVANEWASTCAKKKPSFETKSSLKCKEKTIKSLNKIKKSIKNLKGSTPSSTTASTTTPPAVVSSVENGTGNNKKFLLKRSRKRSKPIVIAQPVDEMSVLKAASPPDDSIIETYVKKSELEPLNKKLAIDNSELNRTAVRNVDFHIEQFSQLDLHSSEDDSSELFSRNFHRKFKKPLSTTSGFKYEMNEKEITKRTRYSSSDSESRVVVVQAPNDHQHLPQQQHHVITPKTSQKDIDKLIQLLKESSSLSSSTSSTVSSYSCPSTSGAAIANTSDTNNSSNESNDLLMNSNKNSKRKKLVQSRTATPMSHTCNTSRNSEEFTLNDFKSLDIDSEIYDDLSSVLNENSNQTTVSTGRDDRQKLWSQLKSTTNQNEILSELGPILAEKMSFWDLAKLKLKHSKNGLRTTYDIIDDYTLLYANMSKLLECFVKQHQGTGTTNSAHNRSDNSSRSRSSSRNFTKSNK